MAVSLAISPFNTRPSTVAIEKLAYLVSSARLGSRMAIKKASGDLSFRVARSGPTSTPSLPRRWHEAHSFLKTDAPAARSPVMRECAAIRVDDRLSGLVFVGEDSLGTRSERLASSREKLLAPGRVDLRRRNAAVFQRRKQRRCPFGPTDQDVEDRRSNRWRVALPVDEQHVGQLGIVTPSQGRQCGLLKCQREPGPQESDEHVAILGVSPRGIADELGGTDAFVLRGPVVGDRAASSRPDRCKRLFQIELTRSPGVGARVEQTGKHGELPGSIASPLPRGHARSCG